MITAYFCELMGTQEPYIFILTGFQDLALMGLAMSASDKLRK